jgi:hypothetical protein
VSIATNEAHPGEGEAEREMYVQAWTGQDAVIIALTAMDFTQEGPLHQIHIGRGVESPRKGYSAIGWQK